MDAQETEIHLLITFLYKLINQERVRMRPTWKAAYRTEEKQIMAKKKHTSLADLS
jgi:hypothetical protein